MTSLRTLAESSILPFVAKPNRYIGNFLAAGARRSVSAATRAVVIHPDLFETGFCHPDTRSAWHVLNDCPDVAADLAFLPWPDMAQLLVGKRIPLWGIETFEPLADADLLLFTPETALQYVNVLRVLDLAGLPLEAAARPGTAPLVAAMGRSMGNPAPVSDFIDLVFLGEPHAVLPGVARALVAARGATRRERLEAARACPGVMEPSCKPGGTGRAPVRPGTLPPGGSPAAASGPVLLDSGPPEALPLVPLVEVEESGLRLEIRRGGTPRRFENGWRAFLPASEISVEEAVERVERGLKATGFDQVELAGDDPWAHSDLLMLAESLARRHPGVKLVVPDCGTVEPRPALAREILRGRRAPFDWSPLAGSERLRRLLNAPFDEPRFLDAVATAFRGGCHLARFHFGIGWPTETEADLGAIADLIGKVRTLAAAGQTPPRYQVVLSPFVPRPHTPLQWEAQVPPAELLRHVEWLRDALEHGPVQVKCIPVEAALFEAVLARGGPELRPALVEALRSGAATPGTTQTWDSAPWLSAFERAGIALDREIAARDVDGPLPWDGIEAVLPRDVLRAERQKALAAELTPAEELAPAALAAARFAPVPAPVPCSAPAQIAAGPAVELAPFGRRTRRRSGPSGAPRLARSFRIRFGKEDGVRFTSHLDVGRAFERALRRLGLNLAAARGRSAKVSFGPPLPLGMTSEDEYLDLHFADDISESTVAALSGVMPDGLPIFDVRPVRASVESLSQAIDRAVYRITFPQSLLDSLASDGIDSPAARLKEGVARVLAQKEILVPKNSDDEMTRVDARPSLIDAGVVSDPEGSVALRLHTAIGTGGAHRPEVLLPVILGDAHFDARLARIHRLALRISGAGKEFSPLEVVELDFPWWRETLKKRAAAQRP